MLPGRKGVNHAATFPADGVTVAPVRMVVPALLLFLSGTSALIYQLLWIKQLSLIVGMDVHAITIAVSAFFAGLSIGAVVLGRTADASRHPYKLYATVEIGVAALGIACTYALASSAPTFAKLEGAVGPLAWLMPFVMVALPAILMGGTVPVLVRAVASGRDQLSHVSGRLYGANTAGAIAGSLLTVFVLIPSCGVRGSSLVAAALSIVAALMALAIPLSVLDTQQTVASPTNDSPGNWMTHPRRRRPSHLAIVLYSICGCIALGYEVIWSQVIVQWTGTRSFAFAVALATYLTGIALGSMVFSRRAARLSDPWAAFAVMISAAGVIALISVVLLGNWLQPLQVRVATGIFSLTHSEALSMAGRFATAAAWIVLVPTLILGAAFPVVMRLAAEDSAPGHDTGAVLALNTLGGIAGTAITGFILVPGLGLERTLALMAMAACVIGAVAVTQSASHRARWTMAGIGLAGLLVAVQVSPDHLARLSALSRRGDLIFHASGAGGTVAVIEQGRGTRFRRLYIDGVSNSGDSMTSLRYMRLQALLPLLIHRGEPRSALVIGMGTGITSGALLAYPQLETRVCVELVPQIVRAVPFFSGNYDVASDRRVEIRMRDGRRELLRNEQRYDLITLEPPPPSAAGVVNLYSTDFYRLASQRLERDGLLAQWLPLPTQTDADTRSLVRSFLDAFPHATLWTTELHEMLLVGSRSPIELDTARIAMRFAQPPVRDALREVGISSPAALLATWITGRDGLERYAAGVRPVTDDDPRIEYGPWVMPDEFTRTLPPLLAVRTEPPLLGAEPALVAAMRTQRDRLHLFYSAGLHAYGGERNRWAAAMREVMAQDSHNPYYSWFVSAPTE